MDWSACFPELTRQPDPEVEALLEGAHQVKVSAGEFVFHMGSPCHNYLLAVDGTLRVQLAAESGRELTLYRVRAGGSCILTTSCLLSGEHYPAEAIAETGVTALAIEQQEFHSCLDSSAAFRRFVFTNLSSRLAEVIRRMESVTFTSIDRRLAAALLEFHESATTPRVTHHDLAVELGTAREVVSRHLKRLESRGWISLGRGQIEITDPAELADLRDHDSN